MCVYECYEWMYECQNLKTKGILESGWIADCAVYNSPRTVVILFLFR